jgi:nitrogen fixation/metabolism regulation signal transduction histidine kinase
MADEYKHLRKQYLVDREYQFRFVRSVLVWVFGIAVLGAVVAIGLLWHQMYRPEFEQQGYFIAAFIGVSVTLLIELLIAIPIVSFVGIRASHRIVGPIARIKKALEAIGTGDFAQRITLRKGDALEDLAVSINQMAEQLKKRGPSGR